MAHKMNENSQTTATTVANQLVASKVYTNRICTDATSSIALRIDNTQNNNREKLRKKLDGFSWEIIAGHKVPYIIRLVNGQNLKFVATRMAEYKLLKKYLRILHPKVYTSVTPVKAYVITDSEAKILNYINEKHYRYGKDSQFVAGIDYIVHLEDIHNFYLFIKICYNKLMCNITSGYKDKCGFICIDSNPEFCIPYCTVDGQKYFPLFYFGMSPGKLEQEFPKLNNWNLAYLKFCCKIQGIRNDLIDSDSLSVISLDDVKSGYPPETDFLDFWPAKVANSCLLTRQKSFQTNKPGSWFRTTPEVVLDQNTIPDTLTASATIIPHSTQVNMSHMQQQQKQQEQQQIITTQIQAHDNSNNTAYKIQMTTLDGKNIHCINVEPYIYSDLMVTLKDLILMVLPLSTVAKCAHILHICLARPLLFGKSEQLTVLHENGLINSTNPGDTPMAMLKDVIQVLPQLKAFVLMQDEEIKQYVGGPSK